MVIVKIKSTRYEKEICMSLRVLCVKGGKEGKKQVCEKGRTQGFCKAGDRHESPQLLRLGNKDEVRSEN